MKSVLVGPSLLVAMFMPAVAPAQHPAMPPGMSHEEHLAQMQKEAEMKKRGAAAMGFAQDATTHHFGLTTTGGFIQVQINDPSDAPSRDAIRAHLKDIAAEFEGGDFSKPFMTHAENPPGVATMQRMRAAIQFRLEETKLGARMRLVTRDVAALQGIHDFLRYQITEHRTGDPLGVQK